MKSVARLQWLWAMKVRGIGIACRLTAQAALVELVEESGLPPVCAALAVAEDADKQLGVVLAEAVQVGGL